MKPKIEARAYGYQGDDVCSISATLNIYTDDGSVVVASTSLSASYNIAADDFVAEITRQLTDQASKYLVKLADLEAKRAARVPESISFADAVDRIIDPIQAAIGG